jgi:uncharacterized protein YmfQ (DUF2313 family)
MAGLPTSLPGLFGTDYEPAPTDVTERYARQLKQLLPRGSIWNFEPTSVLSKLLLALGDEFARVDVRAADLVEEWDPRTALELLANWERVLGLPEYGMSLSDVTSERQIAAASKLAARGGQTAAYYVDLAARLGFVVSVVETAAYTWRLDVDLSHSTSTYALRTAEARAGAAVAGDRVASRSVAELEYAIRRASPAHTVVLFNYT